VKRANLNIPPYFGCPVVVVVVVGFGAAVVAVGAGAGAGAAVVAVGAAGLALVVGAVVSLAQAPRTSRPTSKIAMMKNSPFFIDSPPVLFFVFRTAGTSSSEGLSVFNSSLIRYFLLST
jgi:hypothetical protein